MEERVDSDGKLYVALSNEDIINLPEKTMFYYMGDNVYAIPPRDCEHSFAIEGGCPRNIKYCTKCIYWEFTDDPPTK